MRKLIFLLVFLLSVSPITAAEPGFDLRRGEKLTYDISFLFFSKMGKGTLSFSPTETEGVYRAVVKARALGVVGWVSKNRQQSYETLMKLDEKGLLHPVSTKSTSVKGGRDALKVRITQYDFDEKTRTVKRRKWKNRKRSKDKVYPYPAQGEVFDVLSAFYNWRLGNFGQIKPGTTMRLPAFKKGELSELVVHVLSKEQQRKMKRFPSTGMICRVETDQDVFDTGDGAFYVWLNRNNQPGKLVVEDVAGLGDVWARQRVVQGKPVVKRQPLHAAQHR